MNVQEFDDALTDLETRVDRLRALYENWFRGYEKMEPSVARKDVERRVYGMRKDLPRNTALRFRYHQLYQRYTTLTTYWTRTARQIEEGTYRLQLQRMKRRRPDDADMMRTRMPPPKGADDDSQPPPSYELNMEESLDVSNLLAEADIEQLANALDRGGPRKKQESVRPSAQQAAAAKPLEKPVPLTPAVASARFARPSVANDVVPVKPSKPTQDAVPAAAQAAPPKPPPLKIPPAPGTGTMAMPPVPRMGSKPNGPGTGTIPLPPPPSAAKDGPPTGTVPLPPSMSKPSAPRVPGPPPPAFPASAPTGTRPLPPLPGRPSDAARAPASDAAARATATPSAAREGTNGAAPSEPRPASAATSPGVRPAAASAPGAARPAAAAPVARTPVATPTNATPAVGAPGTPARPANPTVTTPVPAQPKPAPRGPIPSQAPRSGDAAAGMSEQRMRHLYDEYVAARRKNNEGEVRYEALAGTIQKMLPDLSKKHQGKKIDFEVVLKDGRVGLKPKAT